MRKRQRAGGQTQMTPGKKKVLRDQRASGQRSPAAPQEKEKMLSFRRRRLTQEGLGDVGEEGQGGLAWPRQ